MGNADITITVSGTAKKIPLVILEHLDFTSPLRFRNGVWSKKFKNFPIDTDEDLDFALVIAGIPGNKVELKIDADYKAKQYSKSKSQNFGKRGWAVFKDELPLK